MMIAVAFQVLESRGDSLTCSDDSLWHFLTIHFQRSAEVRFHPRFIDVRVHNLLSRADVEWFICPLLLTRHYCSPPGKQACHYSEEPYNAAMPRELVWIDQPGFRGWGYSQCAWISQTRFRAGLILDRAVFDRQDSRTGQCFRAPSFRFDVELLEGCAAYAERFSLSSSVPIWTGFFANGVTYCCTPF